MQRVTAAVAFAVAAMLSAGPAVALVDPNFTPQRLHADSRVIFQAVASPFDDAAKLINLKVGQAIKGKMQVDRVTLDLTDALATPAGVEGVAHLRALLRESPGEPILVFLPANPKSEILIHASGIWLRATQSVRPDGLIFDGVDRKMNGTFNGGTDMLIATMNSIANFPDRPIMPVEAGVRWASHVKIGSLGDAARASALKACDINGDGKLDIFAASPAGDRAWLAKDGEFEPLAGLTSASLSADWADFDGDGRPDLASLSASELKLFLQAEAGKFRAVAIELPGKKSLTSPTVVAADINGDGMADLVVGGGTSPILLINKGQGKLVATELKLPDSAGELGQPGPVVIADFNCDGRLDVLATFALNSLLWMGAEKNTLADAMPAAVAMGKAKTRSACVADLSGDGRPVVILFGGGVKPTAHVFVDGRFRDVSAKLGEPSYIVQGSASCITAGDFNNDTFVDLFVGYSNGPSQCFFNRSHRSFAICEPLKLPESEIAAADKGQSTALWVDLDGDGAMDLLTPLNNGDLWLSETTQENVSGIAAVIGPKCPVAGPVTVTVHADDSCLGGRTVAGRFCPPAFMGVPRPGRYVVKWRLPGRPEASLSVTVQDSPVSVTIE